MYPKELKAGSQSDICIPIFKTALFTIVKRRKQPYCPSMGEEINKMWYRHIILFSLKKKNIT